MCPGVGVVFVGVDNFEITIADRELLVLFGPSGCGKTTTMRMIAGLECPTDDEINIGDKVVNDLKPQDRDVAMMFQSCALFPNMNVYDNIRFPLKVRGGVTRKNATPKCAVPARWLSLTTSCTVSPPSPPVVSASVLLWPVRLSASRAPF